MYKSYRQVKMEEYFSTARVWGGGIPMGPIGGRVFRYTMSFWIDGLSIDSYENAISRKFREYFEIQPGSIFMVKRGVSDDKIEAVATEGIRRIDVMFPGADIYLEISEEVHTAVDRRRFRGSHEVHPDGSPL